MRLLALLTARRFRAPARCPRPAGACRAALLALALLLAPASLAGAQQRDTVRRDTVPVRLPPATTTAAAPRLSPHAYWRGVDPDSGCPLGLDIEACERLDAALDAMARHRDPLCRTAATRARVLLRQGRVIVPAEGGPLTGDRVSRGDLVLPSTWLDTKGTLTALVAAQVSDDAMDAVSRCRMRDY